MEVTLTDGSMKTRADAEWVVKILETVMGVHQKTTKEDTHTPRLVRKGVGVRVLVGSTGVRQ